MIPGSELHLADQKPVVASEPLLAIRNLSVRFGGSSSDTSAVRSLSMDVFPGRSVALVGESGSGKTVSMRSLLGLLPAGAQVMGSAKLAGRELLTMSADEIRKVRGREVAMVFQNALTALNPTRTLKAQLTEHLRWHHVCSQREAHDRAVQALRRVGIPEPERRINMYPFQLSGGMRQRATIAMAIVGEPSLLIADEPTTALDVTVQRQVLDVLKNLSEDGLAVVMVTHDLGVARYMCDDVVVMRHGEVVESAPTTEFISRPTAQYSRVLVSASPEIQITAPTSRAAISVASPASPLLRAQGLRKTFHGRGGDVLAVADVDITVARGETLSIVGESGSGKSTLARLAMGLLTSDAGKVEFDGNDLNEMRSDKRREFRRRTQMVFQNPFGSLLPHRSIADNIAEPLRVHGVGGKSRRYTRALELMSLVGLPTERASDYPRQFSGGQQQRVAIARALALEPDLLICDEPTSALDVSIQAQVLDLLDELKSALDLSMLFITHNLAVAQRMSDRIAVMRSGQIVESADSSALFTDPLHPYTRALISAVLPVRSPARPLHPPVSLETEHGLLQEVAPGHLVREYREEVK